MGQLEMEVKKQVRNTKIQRAVLQSLAIAGGLSIALLAPNALQILRMFDKNIGKTRGLSNSIRNAATRLAYAGLVRFEETGKGKFLRLTPEGEKRLKIAEARNFQLKKPKRWDKKWRIIIFDIKEERKTLRNKIRHTLRQIGFTRLQDSVWVYPYDCEDLITLLKIDFKIGKDVLYIIADKIENDKQLKKQYGLSV